MTQKHTPLPWEVGLDCYGNFSLLGDTKNKKGALLLIDSVYSFDWDTTPDEETELVANAEFIVNACNSHYDLLEACETVRDILMHESEEVWEFEILRLDNAIKKAEGS